MQTKNQTKFEKISEFINVNPTANTIYKLIVVSVCVFATSLFFKLFTALFQNYNQMKTAYYGK